MQDAIKENITTVILSQITSHCLLAKDKSSTTGVTHNLEVNT